MERDITQVANGEGLESPELKLAAMPDYDNPDTITQIADGTYNTTYKQRTGYDSPWTAPIEYMRDKYEMGDASVVRGVKGFELWSQDNLNQDEERAALSDLQTPHLEAIQKNVNLLEAKLGPRNFFQFTGDAMNIAPSMMHTVKGGGIGAAVGAVGGGLLGAAITRNPAGAIIGAQSGAKTLYGVGALAAGVQLNIGGVYAGMVDKGIPRELARKYSMSAGLVMGGLEYFGVDQMSHVGRLAFAKQLKTKAGKEAVANMFKMLPPELMKHLSVAGSIVKGAGSETATEVSQDAVELYANAMVEYVSSDGKDRPWESKKFWQDAQAQLMQTAITTARGSLALAGGTHVAGDLTGKGTATFKDLVQRAQIKELQAQQRLVDQGMKSVREGKVGFGDVMEAIGHIVTGDKDQELEKAKLDAMDMTDEQAMAALYPSRQTTENGTTTLMTGVSKSEAEAKEAQAQPSEEELDASAANAAENMEPEVVLAEMQGDPDAAIAEEPDPAQNPDIEEMPEDAQMLLDGLFDEEEGTSYQESDSTIYSEAMPEFVGLEDTDPESNEMTEVEVQARVNQLTADIQRLTVQEQDLIRQMEKKKTKGHKLTAMEDRLAKIQEQKENLQFERDVTSEGFRSRNDVAAQKGQVRMSVLSKLIKRLERNADSVVKTRKQTNDRISRARGEGFKSGDFNARQAVRSLQGQLIQVINAATKNQKFRNDLKRYVNKVTNVRQFKTAAKKVDAALREMETKADQKQYEVSRKKLLDKIDRMTEDKTKTVGGKPTSNYDADTIARLKKFRVYAASKVLAERALLDFDQTHGTNFQNGDLHLIPDEALEDRQMAILANDLENRNLMELNIIQGNIAQWLQDSRDAMLQKKEAQKLEDELTLNTAKASLGVQPTDKAIKSKKAKPSHPFSDFHTPWLMWNSLLKYITPKDAGHALAALLDTTMAKAGYYAGRETSSLAMTKKLQETLDNNGFANTDINKKAYKDSNEIVTFTYTDQEGNQITTSPDRAQMIDIWMKMQDTSLHDTMRDADKGNSWTFTGEAAAGTSFQEQLEALLKPEDKLIGQAMIDFYADYHARVNAVYREKYGVDLPMRENYSPLNRTGYDVDPGDGVSFGALLPKSSKNRNANLNRVDPQNAYSTIDQHIDQWEHFMSYDTLMRKMRVVMKNADVRTHIADNFGNGTVTVLNTYQQRFIQNRPTLYDNSSAWLGVLMKSLSWAALGFKPVYQMAVQLSAGMSMWADYNPVDVAKGAVMYARNLGQTEQEFRNSAVLKHRYKEGASQEFKQALSSTGRLGGFLAYATKAPTPELGPGAYNVISKLTFAGMRLGDAGVVRVFGGPLYWAEIAKGSSPEQAMRAVERVTEQTQQSDAVDQMPHVFAQDQWKYFALGMFRLQPLQLYGQSLVASRDFLYNDRSAKGFAKLGYKMMSMWMLPGLMYGLVKAAPSLIAPSGDDDDRDKDAIFDIVSSTILGPANAVPGFGDAVEWLWWQVAAPAVGVDVPNFRKSIGGDPVSQQLFENPWKAIKSWGKVLENTADVDGDVEEEDATEDAQKAVADTVKAVSQLAGAPGAALNMPGNIVSRVEQGDWIGASFALGGWSTSQLTKRGSSTDEEDEEEDYGDEEDDTPLSQLIEEAKARLDAMDNESEGSQEPPADDSMRTDSEDFFGPPEDSAP
jgi:hypothetical protein